MKRSSEITKTLKFLRWYIVNGLKSFRPKDYIFLYSHFKATVKRLGNNIQIYFQPITQVIYFSSIALNI